MSKPQTKKMAHLNRAIEDLDTMFNNPSDERFKRQQKKLLKRARTKHERGLQRRELKDRIDGE